MAKLRVLVVEDDEDILELILINLNREGHQAEGVTSGEEALARIGESPPDLVLLDVMLPGMDGLEVCKKLRSREETASLPIMIITAKTQETDQVVGLEMGADDYLIKPFSPHVLLARIKALLRRRDGDRKGERDCCAAEEIKIDFPRHEVLVRNKPVALTLTEFNLLKFLVRRPGWVFSREQILDAIRGGDYNVTIRSIDFHILRLRKKLGDASRCIETVRGMGYRFRDYPKL